MLFRFGQQHAVAQHQAQQIAARGAERGADADLMGSLFHRIRNHAIDADGGEQDGHGGKHREQHGAQTVGGHGFRFDLLQRLHFGERLVFVDFVYGLAERQRQAGRIHRGAHHQRLEEYGALIVGHIHPGVVAAAIEIVDLFVGDDAHDLPGNLRPQLRFARDDFLNEDAFADGLFVLEVDLAMDSLMTVTGVAPFASWSPQGPPLRSFMPRARKYDGLTILKKQARRFARSTIGLSAR